MQSRKAIVPVLVLLFAASSAFCQSEVLKSVVNNLAFYNQKKDLKFLASAKKSVDSLIVTRADSSDLQKNVYRAVVNSAILYTDSLNRLSQPANFFTQTLTLVDKLSANRKIYKFQPEIDFAKRCLANVYLRKAFAYSRNLDFVNALQLFKNAQRYAPAYRQLNNYIAYANNKLGNLPEAAKYYTNVINSDSTKAEYFEAASNIYKAMGDTAKALDIVKKGRRLLPTDMALLLDEANIYNNKKDYKALLPLLPTLLDNNGNNADIAFVAASCYDHLNNYDKAESLYLQAIELNNSAYDPIFNLGLLYFKRGGNGDRQDLSRATQWLEKANEISPNDVNCLQTLQLVYSKTGNTDQLNKINDKLKQLTDQ